MLQFVVFGLVTFVKLGKKISKFSKKKKMNTPLHRKDGPSTISPAFPVYSETFPYCQRAKTLLTELKRAEWLPVYDEEGIRAVTEECKQLQQLLTEMGERDDRVDPKVQLTLSTFHLSICRNKRCILAYLSYRIEKIEQLWWKTASPVISAEYAAKLSRSEIEYYSRYQELVTQTMEQMDLDLTSHIEPPSNLFIEVRAVQDAGEVLLQSGARVFLQKNTTHFLRRSDVEHLIRQDVLEQVS
jgi:GINS complex subunit 1